MRILYNVTVKVDHSVAEDWTRYMQDDHIPDVMATKCFESYKFNKLLYLDDKDGVTFAVQYIAPSIAAFNQYQDTHAPSLQLEHKNKYGDKALAFRTLMEIIKES